MIINPLDNKPIIAYNRANAVSVGVSDYNDEYPPQSLRSIDTCNYWKPFTLPAWARIVFSPLFAADYCAINGNIRGFHYRFTTGNGVFLGECDAIDDKPILCLFKPRPLTDVRVDITRIQNYNGSPLDAPIINIFQAGRALKMPNTLAQGVTPISLSVKAVRKTNISTGGQSLGSSVIRSAPYGSISFENIDTRWYRENIEPFASFAQENPFFIAWRPKDYPNDLAFGYASGEIKPTHRGTIPFCSFSIDIQGVG